MPLNFSRVYVSMTVRAVLFLLANIKGEGSVKYTLCSKASENKVCRKPVRRRLVKYVIVITKPSDSADLVFSVTYSCDRKLYTGI